ncbi:GNAT family N-acetyltransferase [Actinophytocola sp.]|uniref:GNAT family N-acetyltransferase n=1 Tax=Actinophytocola sp. TaxID=1872138 RepID=UPI002ED45266
MAGTPVLTDGVITLRRHQLSDVDEIVEQCTDPESIRWTTVPNPYDRVHAKSFVTEDVPDGWHTRKDLNFAIEAEHPDGRRKFSGSISLRPMGDGIAEIAFGLHPAVRGSGVCSRAVKLILDWGFQEPDIDVVVWYAYVGNWGSLRVAWANGFTWHGTVPKFLRQRGERKDTWYGSLRADDAREPKHPWHTPPVLESDRLRLRPHRLEDAPRFAEVLADERSRHFAGRAPWMRNLPPNKEQLINRALEFDARGERYDWTIADRDTDLLIGQIQLFHFGGLDDTSAEAGYSVHPEWRGRGVVTESLRMLTEWSFRAKPDGGLGLRRVSLGIAGTNKASRYAAEKAGFIQVATLPEGFPISETGFDDEVIYHQLNPSWTD